MTTLPDSRTWRPIPAPDLPDGLILFDGVCILCSNWVRFVVRHDRTARFRFAAVQHEPGRTMARRLGIDPDSPETNAVVIDGMAWFKSAAALAVLQRLPGWRGTALLGAAPRPLRHWAYDRIARNRYALFGRTDACMVPTPDIARRILDAPPAAH